jgi:pterin-4a-carbinolamine dehydratase
VPTRCDAWGQVSIPAADHDVMRTTEDDYELADAVDRVSHK